MIDWLSKGIDLGNYASRTSGWVKIRCPECTPTRSNKADRSLSCNMETGYFQCHHCGWHGYATVNTQEEKEQWMRQQPWFREYTKKSTAPKRTYERPPKPRTTKLSPEILAFFAKRKISEKTLELMRVTEGTDWMPANHNHRLPNGANCRTIHFNYYKDGELIATKLRSGDKCFRQAKAGCEQICYNLDGIKNTDDCYIVEGEMDALSLAEIGYTNVVSVPDGGSDKAMHWLVDYYEEYFANKKTIYICSDNDGVGSDLCAELQKHFEPGTYVIVTDYGTKPDGTPCKDANDCLMFCGPDTLRKKLDEGKSVQPQGDADMEQVAAEMDELYENGLPKGIPIGLPPIDEIMRIQRGRLYIVTGTPGSGKSQFLDHLAILMNVNNGWKFSVFSPEMMPLSLHGAMLVSKYIGKPFSKEEISRLQYEKARDRIKQVFHFIEPEDYELDDILSIAKYQVRKYGCDALILDPWNDLMHQGNGISKTDDINDALLRILNFAHRQDVTVFVMAHPTKQERKKDGTYPKTTLNDISGGAHFRNRADFGFVIIRHRHDDPDNTTGNDYTEFVLEKTRFGNIATLGTAYLRYQPGSGRFHPFDPVANTTQWDERNYLEEKITQPYLPLQQPLSAAKSEANIEGFLQQSARAAHEHQQPIPDAPQDPSDPYDNSDLPFDNNEETPY